MLFRMEEKREIIIAAPHGVCAGVRRALEAVESVLLRCGIPVYVLHEIVHNDFIVNNLRSRGVHFAETLDEVPEGAVLLFSAHGVSAAVEQEARKRKLRIVDATCPLVKRLQVAAAQRSGPGDMLILIGHRGHPEVEGVLGRTGSGVVHVVESEADIAALPDGSGARRITLLAQTTLNCEAVEALVYEKAASARMREIALRSKLGESRAEWKRSLESNPVEITARHIQEVITAMTGIPAERVSDGEMIRLQTLREHLAKRVVGQQEAVEKISRTIRRSRAGLKDENRPIGVFLFVGPTGVGKTLLAKEVSKWLFDERRGLIRIDMSEYGEKHNVARLIGSPPGYVGYGEGGQLTEAVRRQPYAVVLFDEIEKAHPEVFNAMLQIFDEGHLTDGSGRKVDFRNTIIIMTSNVGSRAVVRKSVQVGYSTTSKSAVADRTPQSEYCKALEHTFAPEFLNRIDDIVLFRTLEIADVERIVDLELQGLMARTGRLGYKVKITEGAKRRLATMGYESRYGVRSLKRTLMDNVEEPLSTLIIEGRVNEGAKVKILPAKAGVTLKVA